MNRKILFWPLAAVLLTACEKGLVEDVADVGPTGQVTNSVLQITTRSAAPDEATVAYPVQVYVFAGDECRAVQTIGDAGQTLNIALVEGTYSVYAIGGASTADYVLPTADDATVTSAITLKDGRSHGDLLKVLGKTTREDMMICRGELFCKDDKVEGFTSDTYLSYRFPSADELKEVLDILRGNKPLLEQFEKASMHINPNSTFWVRDTAKRFLFLKKPQYYNAQTGEVLSDTKGEEVRYRLTLAYFNQSKVEL